LYLRQRPEKESISTIEKTYLAIRNTQSQQNIYKYFNIMKYTTEEKIAQAASRETRIYC
jgi:hypothetical protein